MANKIHPTALIGPQVDMGTDNIIGPGAIIIGPCEIGDNNWIGPYSVIGTPGQYQGVHHPAAWDHDIEGQIKIGDRNVFREFVTLQISEGTSTIVEDDCYFMTQSHIPHDAYIESGVKLANSVHLGGFVHVGKVAYIGMGAIVHQRLVIGAGSMVGMGSVVTRHVPPLAKAFGNPAVVRGINSMRFDDFALSERDRENFQITYSIGELPVKNVLSDTALEMFEDFESIVQGQESSY